MNKAAYLLTLVVFVVIFFVSWRMSVKLIEKNRHFRLSDFSYRSIGVGCLVLDFLLAVFVVNHWQGG